MFHHYYKKHGFKWAKRLSRNFHDDNPPAEADINWWISTLEKYGFRIKKIYNYVPELIIRFYLIGFRPMFQSLTKMYNMLPDNDRIELKKQWIDDLQEVFTEFVDEKNCKTIDPSGENILHMIDAEKIHEI